MRMRVKCLLCCLAVTCGAVVAFLIAARHEQIQPSVVDIRRLEQETTTAIQRAKLFHQAASQTDGGEKRINLDTKQKREKFVGVNFNVKQGTPDIQLDVAEGLVSLRNKKDKTKKNQKVIKIPQIPIPINKTAWGEIVTPHPFKFVIEPKKLCKDKKLFLIVYVHTSPDHYKQRALLREIWGNQKFYNDTKLEVINIMGKTTQKPEVTKAVQFESEQYGDILLSSFEDTYRNLSYKGVSALKWVSRNCKQAKFVLKTDDDVFVNMIPFLKHLKDLVRVKRNTTQTLMGLVWYRSQVKRKGKWAIPTDVIEGDLYPVYCMGVAYLMTPDVARALYAGSFYTKLFWVEDVYISGMVAKTIGVKHVQLKPSYHPFGGKLMESNYMGKEWFRYFFSHFHDMDLFQSLWKRLVEKAARETIPELEDNSIFAGVLPKHVEPRKDVKRKQ